jgi:hypothetical protein
MAPLLPNPADWDGRDTGVRTERQPSRGAAAATTTTTTTTTPAQSTRAVSSASAMQTTLYTSAFRNLVGWIGQVRAVPRSLPPPQRRTLDNGMRAAGMVADGRRRWRVQEILQERGCGARAEALIRWEGFDPRSGQPWPDSWERVSGLTADLRELLQSRAPPRQVPVPFRARPEVQADGLPARVSPRLAERRGASCGGGGGGGVLAARASQDHVTMNMFIHTCMRVL